MPSVGARNFEAAFTRILHKGGRLNGGDVGTLERLVAGLKEPHEKQAARDVLALVKHDLTLDQDEVGRARTAMATLLGVDKKALPKDLEQALRHAVPLPNVRVRHYDLSFDFDVPKDKDAFPARARIELQAPVVKSPAILEVDPDRLVIDEIKVGGKVVPFSQKDGRLYVEGCDGHAELDIRYQVRCTDDKSSYGLIRDKYNGRMFTLLWPYNTGALFPSSRPQDAATAEVKIHVGALDKDVDVVSTGAGKSDGNGTTTFRVDTSTPAYALSLGVGKFTDLGVARRGGYEAQTFGLGKSLSPALRKEVREHVAEAMEHFSKWLGPYPFGKRMNIVEVSFDYGGMEHAGAIALDVHQGAPRTIENAVHETLHMWFGDSARIERWGEYWVNEGFTQYATFRFFGHKDGEPAFHKLLDRAKGLVRDELASRRGAGAPLVDKTGATVLEVFTDIQYQQGPWMLRMVEARLGRDVFDRVLASWWQRAQGGGAVDTAAFVAHVKHETNVDLTTFFSEWNHLKSLPTFTDKCSFDGGPQVHLEFVDATKHGKAPSGIEIPVVVHGTKGERRELKVAPGAPVDVDVGFRVRSIEFDPNHTVLADVV